MHPILLQALKAATPYYKKPYIDDPSTLRDTESRGAIIYKDKNNHQVISANYSSEKDMQGSADPNDIVFRPNHGVLHEVRPSIFYVPTG